MALIKDQFDPDSRGSKTKRARNSYQVRLALRAL